MSEQIRFIRIDTATAGEETEITREEYAASPPIQHGGFPVWPGCPHARGMAECQLPPGHDGKHRFGDMEW